MISGRRVAITLLFAGFFCLALSAPALAARASRPLVLASVSTQTYGATTHALGQEARQRAYALPLLIYCLARLQVRNYEGAILACNRALVFDPDNANGYRMRGAANLALRHAEASLPDFDRALALEPGNADGYALRGTAYRELDKFAPAIDDFSAAIALRPEDDRFWNGRCWVRAVAGVELNRALADCRHAFRLRPDRANTLDSIGFVYLRLARWHAAYGVYDSALALEPGLATSLFGRGLAKLHLYGIARARDDVARAFNLDPSVASLFVKTHLIAQTSPLLLCQGKACPEPGPVPAPRKRPNRHAPQGSVRVTKA